MLARLLVLVALVSPQMLSGGSRPADIAFRVQMIDPGFSESVAVADFNKDGRLDILSAEYWYASPGWTKNKIRTFPSTEATSTTSATCPWTWMATGTRTSSRSHTSPGASSG